MKLAFLFFPLRQVHFLSRQKHSKKYALVHCTHGYNQTGYITVQSITLCVHNNSLSLRSVMYLFLSVILFYGQSACLYVFLLCRSHRQQQLLLRYAPQGSINLIILMHSTHFIMKGSQKMLYAHQLQNGTDLLILIFNGEAVPDDDDDDIGFCSSCACMHVLHSDLQYCVVFHYI